MRDITDVIASATKFGRGAIGDAVVAWDGDEAYCLSFDRTVIFRAKGVTPRTGPVVFRACDFEGPDCENRGDKVVFRVKKGRSSAEVIVPAPPVTFSGLKGLFDKYASGLDLDSLPFVILGEDIKALLADDLPHVEVGWSPSPFVRQRDIYQGKSVTIEAKGEGSGGPLAIRLDDLSALYSLCGGQLKLYNCGEVFLARAPGIDAVVGGCTYDTLSILREAER